MIGHAVMKGRLGDENEMILMNGDAHIDKEHDDDDGVNGRATMGNDQALESIAADSVNEGSMDEENEAVTLVQDDDGDDGKRDHKAELDGVQRVLGGEDGTPQIGMVFKSYGDALNFYKQYALRVGFGVAVRKSSFTTYGQCRRLVLVCTKGGKGRANACYQSRPTAKTNCQAMVIVKLWGDGLLHLVEANLEHNHAVSPSAARSMRCYKKMSCGMSKDDVLRADGHENLQLSDKECVNSVEGGRLKLGEGDDEAILQFFSQMQTKNPNFFYLMDLDVEGHLRNIFWADSRSRAAYRYFNDVVYFDTNCLKDKYDIPLVIFVGVNHHGQSVLLGCGLLSDEAIENFLWLFKSWLICMAGHPPPSAIISDDCKAIQDAVAEAFPKARHRICLWHILKNIPKKLGGYVEYKTIKKELEKVIHDSLKINEFEEGWRYLTKRHGLEANEWLTVLYDNRHLWVPAFLRDAFWAGLSISQCKESIIGFFEGCVCPKTSLQQFLSSYEMVLQSKYELETQADFESFHKSRYLVSKLHMEEQLSKLYTLNMFRNFQDELKATVYCQVSLMKVDGSTSTFEIKECAFPDGGEITDENKSYEVEYNVDEFSVQCLCGFYQFKGILCRHALSVLKLQQVYEIPSKYVCNRWRKDFKLLHALNCSLKDVVSNNQVERYDHLSMRCLQLAEFGMMSNEKYQLALKLVRDVENSLLDDNTCRDLQRRLLPTEARSNESDVNHVVSQLAIFDGNKTPNSLPAKRRGRPPKKRKESNMETIFSPSNKETLRASSEGSQSDAFQATSTASHLGNHIRMNGGVDLMEEVNPSDLSFGSHFNLHANHQDYLGSQLQSGNAIQSQLGQQTIGSQSRTHPWMMYQHILQEDQAPFSRRTG